MKITGQFLFDLQWEPGDGNKYDYKSREQGRKDFWEGYAERVNAALSVAKTNQDEQTDDSSGVPSHSLENE